MEEVKIKLAHGFSLFGMGLLLSGPVQASPIGNVGLMAAYEFSGNADDSSGNGNDGVVNGAQLVEDRFGNNNSAYLFDGDDHIAVDHDSSLNFTGSTVSVSFWVNLDQFSLQTFLAKREGTFTDYAASLQSDGTFGFSGENGPFTDWGYQFGTPGLTLGCQTGNPSQ